MALLKDGTRIYGTLYANTEVVIGSLNVAAQINTAFNQANSSNNIAQAAYNQANSSNNIAQAAFNKANSSNVIAQAAFNAANTAAANTVYLQSINNTQNTNITAVNTFAAAAFEKANTGVSTSTDQFARDTANTAASNTVYLQSINNTQNTQIAIIQGVDLTQNTRITSADDLARSAYSQANVGATFVGNGGTISGNVNIQGSLSVSGNVTYTGNVTSIAVTGNTGQFFGYASNGFNALYVGIPTGYLLEPQIILQATANYNGYAGVNMQNINQGNLSSADYFITADNGTANDTFLDLGLASSTYNYPGYDLIKPNDGYFLVYGNTSTGGGNVIIATAVTNDIIFATNGVSDSSVVMRITAANTVDIKSDIPSSSKTTGALQVAGGVGVQGDIQATNVYSQGTNLLGYVQGVNATQNTNITAVNTLAQSAYDKANTGTSSSIDQFARDTANTAASNTVYLQSINDSQNTSISFLGVYTQAAFDKANTGGGGGGGEDKTYTFYQVTAPTTSNAHDLWVNSNTGFVYENFGNTSTPIWAEFGPSTISNTTDVFINTLDRLSNLSSSLVLNNDGSITFNDNTIQTTAYTGFGRDNNAIILASAGFNKANAANVLAQASYDKANTALSNTTGTFGGSLTITGSATVSNTTSITYTPSTTTGTALAVTAAGTVGGAAYADFLKVTNTSSGATNPNKTFRLNGTGGLEIVNSAYDNNLLTLDDSGNLTVTGNTTTNGIGAGYAPNRPAFKVIGNGGTVTAATTMTGSNWTVEFNQGGYLNNTTGIFTAPVDGLYQVNVVVRTNSNTNPTINQIIIRKTAAVGGAVTSQIMVEFGVNTTMNHAGGSALVQLSVGDTLKFDVAVGAISFDGNDNWSVAYIG